MTRALARGDRPRVMPGAPKLLEVRDIGVRFGGIVALDGVSFDLEEGQILGLIGPNGAGKTTLFNCVSRLYTPNRGDILFEGRSLLSRPPHRIAEIGIARTFQNLALFPRQSVLRQCPDRRPCPQPQRFRQRHLAPAVGAAAGERRSPKPPGHCSTCSICARLPHEMPDGLPLGTRKRVELARALAGQPETPAARRAGGRAQPRGGRRTGRPDPAHARRPAGHRAARRASHEPGHVGLRQGRGARFRAQDRRGHAGAGARGRGGDPRLSRQAAGRAPEQPR